MQSESPLVDFDAVCQKVRAAVEPNRTHAVSLHDESGDVLWLSESSMGPDEHNAVREAAEAFSNPAAAPILSFDLGDSKSAVMVRAVNARRAIVGLIMIVMDTRIVAQGAPKLMTPKLQRGVGPVRRNATGSRACGPARTAAEPCPRASPRTRAHRAAPRRKQREPRVRRRPRLRRSRSAREPSPLSWSRSSRAARLRTPTLEPGKHLASRELRQPRRRRPHTEPQLGGQRLPRREHLSRGEPLSRRERTPLTRRAPRAR